MNCGVLMTGRRSSTPRWIGDDQRLIFRTQEPGTIASTADGNVIGQRHIGLTNFLGDDRSHTRITQSALTFAVAGVHVVLGTRMSAFQGAHRADQGGTIHHFGQVGQMLGDSDPRCAGADRLEVACALAIGFHIESVLVAWTTIEPQQHAGFRLDR